MRRSLVLKVQLFHIELQESFSAYDVNTNTMISIPEKYMYKINNKFKYLKRSYIPIKLELISI